MAIDILILIAGLALVVAGAEILVDGASSIARKAGISEFVIGLTIVGMGTSAPEMVVSLVGAIQGNSSISVGNVVGSNIFNTLLILGLSAFLLPIPITDKNIRKDIPMNLAFTVLLIALGMSSTLFGLGTDGLSRTCGILFLLLFAAYMVMTFTDGKEKATEQDPSEKTYGIFVAILMVAGGLAALVFGGNLFVNKAEAIARSLGVSDKFIAVTLLAGGTSLPELATCIVAASKKKGQLALGNILGSNIFNILLILGSAAAIRPVSFSGMDLVDLGVLLLSAVLVLTSAYLGRKKLIDRLDGSLMLIAEAAYMVWLFIKL